MPKTIRLRGQVSAYLKTGDACTFGHPAASFQYEHVGTFTDADGDTYAELRTNPLGTIYLIPTVHLDSYMVGR